MSLPTNLRDLYLKWLDELIEGLTSRQEQLSITYSKAKRNLQETDGVFYYPKDLKKVKGIGDTIIKRLEGKLDTYCKEIGIPTPDILDARSESSKPKKRSTTSLRIEGNDSNSNPKKKKRKYIPKKRSGGYAILLGLLELKALHRGVSKDDIIDIGQKYTDSSMLPNHSTKEFYGTWSSIGSLKKNSLVLEEGRPKRYTLTETGRALAETLKSADQVIFSNENEQPITSHQNSFGYDNEVTVNLSGLLKSNNGMTVNGKEEDSSTIINTTFQNISTPNAESKLLKNYIDSSGNNGGESSPCKPDERIRRRFYGIPYEFWKKGSYEIYPIIDHREIKSQTDREFFSNALARKGMKNEIRQLSLGDIIWVAKNKSTGTLCVLDTIVERKRLDDLAASIRDNRFMEQKNRLENSGCRNKYYLIEETMSGTVGNMSEALKTALWVILIYYRFSVVRTTNSEETVEKLHAIHTVIEHYYRRKDLIVMYPKNVDSQNEYKKILHTFKWEFSQKADIECCHTFECFQDIMGKSDMRTVAELTIQILMYVKGVSLEKAVAIQSLYPTLSHILKAYQQCKSEVEAKNLLFMKLGKAPGNKKINKSLSEKIAEVFSSL